MKKIIRCFFVLLIAAGFLGTMVEFANSEELFNGKSLDGWYKFNKGRGVNNDPNNVFSVVNGVIRISGEEYGCITT